MKLKLNQEDVVFQGLLRSQPLNNERLLQLLQIITAQLENIYIRHHLLLEIEMVMLVFMQYC